MRVFVTGASGWIGRGLVPELIAAGHNVTGLARSDAAAQALRALGVEVRSGSLDDLETLRDAAASSDGVIHLAFNHDLAFSGNFAAATDADRLAIETFGEALAGSGKPFVIASGILACSGFRPASSPTERDGRASGRRESRCPDQRRQGPDRQRRLHARACRPQGPLLRGAAPAGHARQRRQRVHPRRDPIAREKGAAAYVGDGANRWPAVHRDDAARLFRLAFESAPAGSVLHAVGDEGVPIREVAEIFASRLNLPALSISPGQAGEYLGFLGGFWGFDGPAAAHITRDLLGLAANRAGTDRRPHGRPILRTLEPLEPRSIG